MPKDVNTKIADSMLRHQHFIQNYENGVLRNDILPILKKAKKDMVKKFNDFGKRIGKDKLSNLTKKEKAFLGQKIKELDLIIRQATEKIEGTLTKDLTRFSRSEERTYLGILSDAMPIDVAFSTIPLEKIEKIIDKPLGGKKYATRFKTIYGESEVLLRGEITKGIISGESISKVRRRLIGVGNGIGGELGRIITRRSEMIARSEILRVSNAVSDGIYQANTDVIKGVEWLATLDYRTCIKKGKVRTRKGYKDIKDIVIGDYVATHKGNYQIVTNTSKRLVKEYVELELNNGKTIELTADHEVYTNRGWIPIEELNNRDFFAGEKLPVWLALEATHIRIPPELISKKKIKKEVEVYDISVKDDNSFLVDGIFVHNCPECIPLDGQFYDFSKGERPPERPLHPLCRCVVVPITKSWQELGFDNKMAKQMDKLDPGVRATMTGYVPATMNYPVWFATQSASFQKQVLGKSRYELYRKNNFTMDQMITSGRWTTLKDLERLSKY